MKSFKPIDSNYQVILFAWLHPNKPILSLDILFFFYINKFFWIPRSKFVHMLQELLH
jgi:hypothetical protein